MARRPSRFSLLSPSDSADRELSPVSEDTAAEFARLLESEGATVTSCTRIGDGWSIFGFSESFAFELRINRDASSGRLAVHWVDQPPRFSRGVHELVSGGVHM